MIECSFTPSFLRGFNALEDDLAEEALEKIELFKNRRNHALLKVHKLQGKLRNKFSFSVNYRVRIVFEYDSKDEAALLAIGGHNVYR